jgi:hypothetical protein
VKQKKLSRKKHGKRSLPSIETSVAKGTCSFKINQPDSSICTLRNVLIHETQYTTATVGPKCTIINITEVQKDSCNKDLSFKIRSLALPVVATRICHGN